VDAVVSRATVSGAIVRTAAQDAGWGDRIATIIDPFGYIWALATIQRELTAEEFNARGNIQLVEAA
jgi:PhnB protein